MLRSWTASVLLLAALALVTCGRPAARAPTSPSAAYLGDRAARRAALERSLTVRGNRYARLRLERYGVDGADGWEQLPVWNPRVEPITLAEVERPGGATVDVALGDGGRALAVDGVGTDAARLRDLGEAAFFRYPAQLVPYARVALKSPAALDEYGLWRDARHGAGGLLRVELADGSRGLAFSCATCHGDHPGDAGAGPLVIGTGNRRLDLGRLMTSDGNNHRPDDPRLGWGRGRIDVTTADGEEPVRIPDLRPTRWLTHLHRTASVTQEDVVSLAVRLETLLITAHGGVVRPPREATLGLAVYLWSLAAQLDGDRAPLDAAARRGAALLEARCGGCHQGPGLTGPPVAVERVGTDPALTRSGERGTGLYRVPSLRGVNTRGALLHDGSAPDVAALLDPVARARHHVTGHAFGLSLDAPARADLLAYLATL